jgi:hypothetical protein
MLIFCMAITPDEGPEALLQPVLVVHEDAIWKEKSLDLQEAASDAWQPSEYVMS